MEKQNPSLKKPLGFGRQYCRVCGRRLRDGVSQRRGIGPECWERIQIGKYRGRQGKLFSEM